MVCVGDFERAPLSPVAGHRTFCVTPWSSRWMNSKVLGPNSKVFTGSHWRNGGLTFEVPTVNYITITGTMEPPGSLMAIPLQAPRKGLA